MFRDILVPLDGSHFAEAALPLASRLAQLSRARLHLLLAHQPAPVVVGMGDMLPPPPELDEDRREQEREYLSRTAAALRRPDGVSVGFLETLGAPGPEICEEASRLDADLVVMATHGRGTFKRIWLGSVADYAVRHLSAPILLVPPGPPDQPARHEDIQHIMVALDLSKDSEAILEPVTSVARLTGAQLTLLHVVEVLFAVGTLSAPAPAVAGSELLETSQTEAERQLERIAERLRRGGLRVSTRATSGINAAGGVLDALNEERYDLIALTTHGRGGLRRVLLGSVADKVIRGSTKPVLVLRPPALVPTG